MRLAYNRGVLYSVAAVGVALLIALLVGWNLILVENYLLQDEDPSFRWIILSLGCLAFVIICLLILGMTRYLIRTDERQSFQQVLLDSVSHELKSPLASMKLLIETMQMRQLPADKEAELRASIIEELERLNQLVDDMLETGREGKRRRQLQIRRVNVRAVIDRVTEHLRRRWGDTFELELDLEDCRDEFPTDGPALEIALFNLLDNAVKYSDAPAKVRFQAINDWDWLNVKVTDQGMGIERRELRRVFFRFYRAKARQPEEYREGVGLGLFVVRELVKRLGGRVWAESGGRGQGTCVHLRIPAGNLADEPVGGRSQAADDLAAEGGSV